MEPFGDIHYRIDKRLVTSLPFGVRSVGHRLARDNFCSRTRSVNLLELMWCMDGVGELCVDGVTNLIPPGHVAFIAPGPQRYFRQHPGGARWHYRWLTLDGDFMPVFEAFGVSTDPRFAGPCPEEDFIQLENEVCDTTPAGERAACGTAFRILIKATGAPIPSESHNIHVERARELFEQRLGDPALSVNMLATEMGVDRSTLSRLFREYQQIPPSTYITKQRLRKSMELLRTTGLPISTIATDCGFADIYYFSRVFSKNVGIPPRVFREEGHAKSYDIEIERRVH